MKLVILCGGQGTRIRDVSNDIPKPMIPVGDYPILWHIMKYYSRFDINDFVLCIGYKGQIIKDFFLNYEAHTKDVTVQLGGQQSIKYHSEHSESDWKVTLVNTGLNAMTGARVRRIQKHVLDEENFMLTYGDGLGSVDIKALMDFHIAHKKIMTVTGVRPPGRFGEMVIDPSGLLLEFNEKPQATAGLISGGFFVCRREIFEYLDDREDLVFEKTPMNSLVVDKQIMLYEHTGFWQPMDTYRDYLLLNDLYNEGKAPWKIW